MGFVSSRSATFILFKPIRSMFPFAASKTVFKQIQKKLPREELAQLVVKRTQNFHLGARFLLVTQETFY